MRALIAGASGLVGSHVVRMLLDSPDWKEVISLVRKPTGLTHAKLREPVVDFAQLESVWMDPVDSVFCCLGTTLKKAGSLEAQRVIDVDYVVALARLGRARGAQHLLVVSSLGADPDSASAYLRMKGEMEKKIGGLAYPAVDVLQPSLLLGERGESRPTESLMQWLMQGLDPVMHWLLPRYRAIAAEKVARAMVTLAESPVAGYHRHASETIPTIGAP